MEIAKIVLEYLKVLIWPFTAMLGGYAMRRHLAGLFRRIQAISTPAGDLEFAADVNHLHDAALEAVVDAEGEADVLDPPPSRAAPPDGLEAFAVLREVAETAPEAAIMAAWRRVELRLAEAHAVVEGTPSTTQQARRVFPVTPRRWIDQIVAAGLDGDIADIVSELITLRNRAAHSPDISGISALEYVESCAVVWGLLGRFLDSYRKTSMLPREPSGAD
ncbi:hypothetical protein ACFY72_04750 [Streptomyces globisporus]|uniref:hypothetical protein n=1 Tax=Streptomyces albovinaceus subgroup TaxID=1482558 RepID=UPI000A35E853|nr:MULTISPECIES: hypothetical protein [Streptomyces albovinaceus subgroup]WSU81854.1 hypothetical protein OG215_14975 [Streptomyces globisporus]